jgi:NAD(P)-dependent dehydrogenase (short-subunit alcohol dehydrogenase family)
MSEMDKIKKEKKLNRSVLITGVTSGIGKEIAFKFGREGWDIIGHYCSSYKAAVSLKNELISKYKINVSLHRADFSTRNKIMKFIKKIEAYNIDTLVNNAGTYISQIPFKDLTMFDLEKTFAVNVFAPMLIACKIFKSMKKQRFGRIVNISSIAAKYGGSRYSMHYGCSKSALEGLTKTLAKEGAPFNILVNTIRPGVIDTDFHKKFPKDMSKRIRMIPVQRMGSPRDIAEMTYYLGSEKNNFISNETIAIAGGE